jgi:diacylglycerol O-acyltransferase
MSKTLSFLDKSFWITESDENPKHVACLQLLALPEGADKKNYVPTLFSEIKSYTRATSPFSCAVKTFLGYPIGFKPVKKLHMDYHVQIHRVANVQNREALDAFVARLHASRLDPDKPLWQYHFIFDEISDTFAIYARVHHMYGDGTTLVRWFQSGYVSHSTDGKFTPIWATKRLKNKKRDPISLVKRLVGVGYALKTVFDLLVIFVRIFMKLLRVNPHYMPVPFTGTKTMLTGQVKAGRAVATVDLDFKRVKALARRTRSTANEVLLCAFDIGVHKLLKEHGQVFKKALYTNMPINLRKPGEKTTGNKIAIVPVKLAHGENDPYLRLRQIVVNHRIVKHAAQHARPAAFSGYTIVIQSMALVFEWLRLSNVVKPIANILISNVPGPKDTRYLKDAKLLACYPISTMTPGGGVNITFMTYADTANVGLVCCNKNVESLQPLALYVREAFDMLEASVDDPRLNIDDIGEHIDKVPLSIVSDH